MIIHDRQIKDSDGIQVTKFGMWSQYISYIYIPKTIIDMNNKTLKPHLVTVLIFVTLARTS